MKAEVALGARLAGLTHASRWSARWRSLSVFGAGVIGTYLLLALAAITASEIAQRPSGIVEPGVKILLVTVVLVVLTPVLTLSATTARLSAATRDRQLASMRLLGLSPSRTRLVAASEVGTAALAGAVMGGLFFLATRSLLGSIRVAGRSWPAATLDPHWLAAIGAISTVPMMVVVAAMAPRLRRSTEALRATRKDASRRPSLLRLLPVSLGIGLASFVILNSKNLWASSSTGTNAWLAPYLFAGIGLLALGTLVAVPWLVRLVGDLLLRVSGRPALLIAGRRMQAQPSGVTRIVAGLLAGLFIVTGARAVVVAFEDTQQYRSAALAQTIGQIGTITVAHESAPELLEQLTHDPDVTAARAFTLLQGACTAQDNPCWRAYVGTCADLQAIVPSVEGCRDDVVVQIQSRETFQLPVLARGQPRDTTEVALPPPVATLRDPERQLEAAAIEGLLLVPPTTPEIAPLLARADVEILVRAAPGVGVDKVVTEAGSWGDDYLGGSTPDDSYFEFVEGLRALVWAIAALVLAVGLLAFGFSAIDRALSRRTEAVSLQLVGVPAGVLRRSLCVEALAPLAVGSFLAIALGFLAGSSFLAYGSVLGLAPLVPTLLIAATAVVGVLIASGLIASMAGPQLRPKNIRTE